MRFNDKKIIALIVAGGSGQRMKACGSFVPKQFARVKDDLTVINYSYNTFTNNQSIFGIQLVFNPQDKIFYKEIIQDKKKLLGIAHAGKTRQASVFSGLLAIEEYEPDYILIHDAVRPLVSSELINNIIEKLNTDCKAVVPILPVTDTVGMLSNSTIGKDQKPYITSILKREQLALLQTPQGFSFSILLECHRKEEEKSLSNTNNSNNINNINNYTDDIGLVQYYNYQVCHVPGELKNFKVTNNFDLQVLCMLKHHGFF